MEQDVITKVQQRLAELPADVRTAITSTHIEQKVRDIGEAYKLHIDQIGLLEDEVYLVMLGFSSPADFPNQIARQLQVPNDQAALIANNVNNEIFLPIRESMQRFSEARQSADESQKKKPAGAIVNPPYTPPAPPAAPAAAPAPSPAAPMPTPPAPKLPVKPGLPLAAQEILTKPTMSTPPAEQKPAAPPPAPPPAYKTDPYREPPE